MLSQNRTLRRLLISIPILTLCLFLTAWIFRDNYWMSRIVNVFEKYGDRIQAFVQQTINPVHFSVKPLQGLPVERPTSIQFGPDQKLYVSTQDGWIYRVSVKRTDAGNYTTETIDTIQLIRQIPNHNDQGLQDTSVHHRQVTGLLVSGTAEHPVVYVSSSDPRIGGIVEGSAPSADGDLGLDTNSGTISQLTWDGTNWSRIDLVRGLPRSEENHSVNGMALDKTQGILYLTCGGNTNAGGPSRAYGLLPEYALSSAILKLDLKALSKLPLQEDANGKYRYHLPTLDDPQRANRPDGTDPGDPYGGNDGLNQARLVPGSPVEIFSPGYRNPYDLALVQPDDTTVRLYTIDNGANPELGGFPADEGNARVTNAYLPDEPGSVAPGKNDHQVNNLDNLHLVYETGMDRPTYGGHPNPIRANPAGAGWLWSDSIVRFVEKPTADWPPVPLDKADPRQSDFQNPGVNDGALAIFYGSTNGIAEYTAGRYFEGSMQGDLVAASFNGNIQRIRLSEDGKSVKYQETITAQFGTIPLDLTCQDDLAIFPGTIWVADFGGNAIYVLEPEEAAQWATLPAKGQHSATARHESAFVECAGKFYLLGGRGQRPIDVFDPQTGRWDTAAPIPGNPELNHFQAVSLDSSIYIIGAFTGPFPDEQPVPHVYIYHTRTNSWSLKENQVPPDRLRGSVSASAYQGKIYLVGGNTEGHKAGAVNWTDCYDPSTGVWTPLADAPHPRDHFQTAIVEGKLYAIGGRRSQAGSEKLFSETESHVDIYDVENNTWQTLPESLNLPTPRAGASTVQAGPLILVIGGESKAPKAHRDVEAYNMVSRQWIELHKLNEGRHGTQALYYRSSIFIAGGCSRQGGSHEINTVESISPIYQ